MPPPQCPECGRFLATAFVEQITTEPAPCPGCGTELSLAPDDGADGAAKPDEAPPVPPPAATLPADEAAGVEEALDEDDAADDDSDADAATDDVDATDDVELGDTTEPASTEVPDGEETAADTQPDVDVAPLTPAAAAVLDDVEPEPETSVRPPDRAPDRDPLEGWDQSGTFPAPPAEPDPTVLAAGAGLGLLLGLLLGGREHRGLGALLGAVLGAVLTRLRG